MFQIKKKEFKLGVKDTQDGGCVKNQQSFFSAMVISLKMFWWSWDNEEGESSWEFFSFDRVKNIYNT